MRMGKKSINKGAKDQTDKTNGSIRLCGALRRLRYGSSTGHPRAGSRRHEGITEECEQRRLCLALRLPELQCALLPATQYIPSNASVRREEGSKMRLAMAFPVGPARASRGRADGKCYDDWSTGRVVGRWRLKAPSRVIA